jgi:hypothetical protein
MRRSSVFTEFDVLLTINPLSTLKRFFICQVVGAAFITFAFALDPRWRHLEHGT